MSCSSLGDMYLKGGPGLPADTAKARAAMDRGCAGSDHYAAGVCGSIGSMLAEGKLGAAPDRNAAMRTFPSPAGRATGAISTSNPPSRRPGRRSGPRIRRTAELPHEGRVGQEVLQRRLQGHVRAHDRGGRRLSAPEALLPQAGPLGLATASSALSNALAAGAIVLGAGSSSTIAVGTGTVDDGTQSAIAALGLGAAAMERAKAGVLSSTTDPVATAAALKDVAVLEDLTTTATVTAVDQANKANAGRYFDRFDTQDNMPTNTIEIPSNPDAPDLSEVEL